MAGYEPVAHANEPLPARGLPGEPYYLIRNDDLSLPEIQRGALP